MSATPICDATRARGEWNAAWDELYALDPAWTEKFMAMAMTPFTAGVIEPKVWEFIAIAVDASCTHLYSPGVRRHIGKALDLGATPQEIMAVLQGVATLGIHSMALAAPMLAEELAARTPTPAN